MTLVVLDLGSNIDREESLASALEHLRQKFTLLRTSSVYRTTPVGMANQPDFYNIAVELETDSSPEEIRATARAIEDAMGRDRTGPKFGPRNIDIDIVLYGQEVDESRELPHPLSAKELFVVGPLAELSPQGSHPVLGKTWKELKGQLMNGRSAKDAGIAVHCEASELPLTEQTRSVLQGQKA